MIIVNYWPATRINNMYILILDALIDKIKLLMIINDNDQSIIVKTKNPLKKKG